MAWEEEHRVLNEALNDLQLNGYRITGAFDGEDYMEVDELKAALESKDLKPILEWTSQAESGSVTLQDEQGDRLALHVLYGNSPMELIYDMSASNEDALTRGDRIVSNCLADLDDEPSAGPSM
ncbi:hypothetical protein [Marinobacter subterrani]|uniref:hypothetical protein n=1 Tax=Marinobacter subterrani TaxID=1658765 RepID=UPI002356F490|nr:hypothetical protein [Marinobacter subterrani]